MSRWKGFPLPRLPCLPERSKRFTAPELNNIRRARSPPVILENGIDEEPRPQNHKYNQKKTDFSVGGEFVSEEAQDKNQKAAQG